jgi:hypothetical protein
MVSSAGPATKVTDRGETYSTVAEVAARLGISARWLADECRAGRVKHVYIARRRRFTAAQIEALVKMHTLEPTQGDEATRLERTRDRVARRLARR